jgi:hypothetical protein
MLFPLDIYPLTTLSNDSRCIGLLQPSSELAVYLFGTTSSNVVWKGEEVLECSSPTVFCVKIAHDRTLVWISKLQENLENVATTSASVSFNEQVVFCSVSVAQSGDSSFSFFWVGRSDGSLVNGKQLSSIAGREIETLYTCVLGNNNVAISAPGNPSYLAIVDPNLNVEHEKELCSVTTGTITCNDELLVEAQTESESFVLFFDTALCTPTYMRTNSIKLPKRGLLTVRRGKADTLLVAMVTADNFLVVFLVDNGHCCPTITECVKIQVSKREGLSQRPSLDVLQTAANAYIVGTNVQTSDGKHLVSEGSSTTVEYVYLFSPCSELLLPTPILENANSVTISKSGTMFVCGDLNRTLQLARVR